MTVLERQQLRQEVMRRQLDLACERAAVYGLSQACLAALRETGPAAMILHQACRAEDIGGTGCLCVHHDDARTGVTVSGSLPAPQLPR
jgi:hypothetical protein